MSLKYPASAEEISRSKLEAPLFQELIEKIRKKNEETKNSAYGHNDNRFQLTRYTENQNQDQRQVRRIQYQQNPAREHCYQRPERNNYGIERENGISNARFSINYTQTALNDNSMERRATSPRRNDQQHSGN
jgi:hypothetical protein